MITLFDTHSHVNFDHFDKNRDIVIGRYKQAGGQKLMLVGCDVENNKRALKYSNEYDFCYSAIGIHPCSIDELTDEVLNNFIVQLTNRSIVAIGEIGLDYYHNSEVTHIEAQKKGFRKQVRLAKKFDVPVIIHSREKGMVSSKIDIENKSKPGSVGDSGRWIFSILKEERIEKVIFHCFSYDLDFAKQVWDMGYYTSFAGIVTYPKNDYLREVVKNAPVDKILIETDCPYLSPQEKRGQDNEPAFVLYTAKMIADIRGVSLEELSNITFENANSIFSLSL